MPPDVFHRQSPPWAAPSATQLLSLVALPLALLAGCATPPTSAPTASTSAPLSSSSSHSAVRLPQDIQPTSVANAVVPAASKLPAPAVEPVDPGEAWAVKFLLGYAERLGALHPGELATEIAALGEPGGQPLGQMQLGLALAHTHQPVDTARALGLFQRVAAHKEAAALPYKPLARLLATRLLDQRKLEDALDRQSQQLREQQRRIEQLTERLEAMRAIERSLNTRPGTPPGSRSTRPAPKP